MKFLSDQRLKMIGKITGKYLLIPIVKYYLRKDRKYSYKGIKILVKKGVFHPGLFYSTKIFVNFLGSLNLKGLKFLELGAGTGLMSLIAAKKDAIVTATDISPLAIENLQINAGLNNQTIQVIESDLFTKIPAQTFDFIIIQPPYYPQKPTSVAEYAWYCGEDFEFFRNLFHQIGNYIHPGTRILMILSDDCDIHTISKISRENGFIMNKIMSKKIFWEWNYIFEINFIIT
jgi:release factor glutamine methyltransferase